MEPFPSLTEAFAEIPDPRAAPGRRYTLSAILNLTALAMLAGMRSLEAIAQFARDHGTPLTHALGFTSAKSPCKATLSNLFRRLDVAAFEGALTRWIRARCPDLGEQLCLDGKAVRGSKDHGLPGAHLLAAYAPHVAAVVAQVRVDRKTNEHKAALELLGVLPLTGTVVTGDAMFGQKDVCRAVDGGGGAYRFTVKDDQPTLHFDIACLFAESVNFSPLPTEAMGVRARHLHHVEQGTRPGREANAHGNSGAVPVSGRLAGHRPGVPDPARAPLLGWSCGSRNRLRDHQSDAARGGCGAPPEVEPDALVDREQPPLGA